MKLLWILLITISLSGFLPIAFSDEKNSEADPEKTETNHSGSLQAVTTRNMWISSDNKNNLWVIDVEGTPKEVYVVDTPAQQEISHYETVHHAAVTHQEPVNVTTTVWYVTYLPDPTVGTTETVRFTDYNEALAFVGLHDGTINETTETSVTYNTVVDQAAYDETVKVIDQAARKESGHKETIMEGEIGHWEQGNTKKVGIGDGHYTSKMLRDEADEKTGEESK